MLWIKIMILYHELFDLMLDKYGIEIPMQDDRATKCYQFLKERYPGNEHKFAIKPNLLMPTKEDLLLAHDLQFVEKIISDENIDKLIIEGFELINDDGTFHRYNPARSSKPLKNLATTLLLHTGACIQGAEVALQYGFAYVLGGGGHHAMTFAPRGFCLVNDIVITIRKMQQLKRIKTAWVVDVDAHKGDGTAQITHGDPSILTLSIHMEKGWPLIGEEIDEHGNLHPWLIPNDIDIPIAEGQENSYLSKLEEGLNKLKKISPTLPELVIVVHGSDPYEHDCLQSTQLMKLSLSQMFQRDMLLYNFFENLKISQLYLMAGGYGANVWEVHAQFLEEICKRKL